jgi:hypothetical protein
MLHKSVRICPKQSFPKYFTNEVKDIYLNSQIDLKTLSFDIFSLDELVEIKSTIKEMNSSIAEGRNMQETLNYFKALLKFEKEQPFFYAFTIYELVKMERFEGIEKILELMEKNQINSSSVVNFINFFPYKQSVQFAEYFSQTPNIFLFEFIMKSISKTKIRFAVDYFNRMSKIVKPNQAIFFALITGCISQKFFGISKAVYFYNIMQKEFGLEPSHEIISSILAEFSHLGDVKKAKIFFKEFKKFKISPDSKDFHHVIKAFLRIRDLDSAFKYLNLAADQEDLKISISIFDLFVGHFATNERNLKKAFKFIESIPEKYKTEIRIEYFRLIISNAFRLGDFESIDRILSIESNLNVKMDLWTLNNILNEFCRIGDTKNAERIYLLYNNQFPEVNPNYYTYHLLLKLYCEAKNPHKASEFAEIMNKKGMKIHIASIRLISECFKSLGDFTKSSEYALSIADEKLKYKQQLQIQYNSVPRNTSLFSNEFKSLVKKKSKEK